MIVEINVISVKANSFVLDVIKAMKGEYSFCQREKDIFEVTKIEKGANDNVKTKVCLYPSCNRTKGCTWKQRISSLHFRHSGFLHKNKLATLNNKGVKTMAVLNFDATKIDPSQVSAMLPVSDGNGHAVVIVSSEFKPVKDDSQPDGMSKQYGYLQLDLEVIDGPNKGERGPYRLNLYNKEPKAVEIAQRQLSAICHVVNVFKVGDSAMLHNIPFRVIIALQKGENPEKYTEVKGVKDINGCDPGKSKGGAAQQQQPVQQQQNTAQGFQGNQQQQPVNNGGNWSSNATQEQQQPVQQQQANTAWQPDANGGGAAANGPAPWQK